METCTDPHSADVVPFSTCTLCDATFLGRHCAFDIVLGLRLAQSLRLDCLDWPIIGATTGAGRRQFGISAENLGACTTTVVTKISDHSRSQLVCMSVPTAVFMYQVFAMKFLSIFMLRVNSGRGFEMSTPVDYDVSPMLQSGPRQLRRLVEAEMGI